MGTRASRVSCVSYFGAWMIMYDVILLSPCLSCFAWANGGGKRKVGRIGTMFLIPLRCITLHSKDSALLALRHFSDTPPRLFCQLMKL